MDDTSRSTFTKFPLRDHFGGRDVSVVDPVGADGTVPTEDKVGTLPTQNEACCTTLACDTACTTVARIADLSSSLATAAKATSMDMRSTCTFVIILSTT